MKGHFSLPYPHFFELARDSKQSLLHPPKIPLLGTYPGEIHPPQRYTRMSIAALCITAEDLNGPKCLSAVEKLQNNEKIKLLLRVMTRVNQSHRSETETRVQEAISWLLF